MNMAQRAMSTLATETELEPWPLLPVETEIYILPDGRVVVADLPVELAPLIEALSVTSPVPTPAVDVAPAPCHE
jgi:hypothetical protein